MTVEPIRPPGFRALVDTIVEELVSVTEAQADTLAGRVLDVLEAEGWTAPGTPEPTTEPCGHQYAAGLVCEQPKGHPVHPGLADTWHRNAHVRWCCSWAEQHGFASPSQMIPAGPAGRIT